MKKFLYISFVVLFSYTTSCDLSASDYHPNPYRSATEPEKEEETTYQTFKAMVGDMVNETIVEPALGAFKLGKAAYTGDYGYMATKLVEEAIVEFCGKESLHYLNNTDEKFDNELLKGFLEVSVVPLMDKFFKYTHKALMKTKYKVDDVDGNTLSVYDSRSLFKAAATSILPEIPVFTDLFIAFFDNNFIKSQCQKKLVILASMQIIELLKGDDSSFRDRVIHLTDDSIDWAVSNLDLTKVRQHVNLENAKLAYNFARENVGEYCNELLYGAATDWPDMSLSEDDPLWGFVATNINSHIREFLKWGLGKVKTGILYPKIDKMSGNKVSSLIPRNKIKTLNHALTVTLPAMDYLIGGNFVLHGLTIASGTASFFNDYLIKAGTRKADKFVETFIGELAYGLFPYSFREHIPKLNQDPSKFDKAYYYDDYVEAERIKNISFVAEIIKKIIGTSCYNYLTIDNPIWTYFKNNPNASVSEFFISEGIDAQLSQNTLHALKRGESHLWAARYLEMLRRENQDAYNEKQNRLDTYKSYFEYKKSNGLLRLDDKAAHEKAMASIENVEETVSAIIDAIEDLISLDEALDMTDFDDLMYLVFKDLTVNEQNLLVEYVKNYGSVNVVGTFAERDSEGNLSVDNIKSLLKKYENELHQDFYNDNAEGLEQLKNLSFAHGLDHYDSIRVLKALQKNSDLYEAVMSVPDWADINYEDCLRETFKDLVADFYAVQLIRKWDAFFRSSGAVNEVEKLLREDESVALDDYSSVFKGYSSALNKTKSFNEANQKTDAFLENKFSQDMVVRINEKFLNESEALIGSYVKEFNPDLESKNIEEVSSSWNLSSYIWLFASKGKEKITNVENDIDFSNLEALSSQTLRLYDKDDVNNYALNEFLKKNFNEEEDLLPYIEDVSPIIAKISESYHDAAKKLSDQVIGGYFNSYKDEIIARCFAGDDSPFKGQLITSPSYMAAWVSEKNKALMNELQQQQAVK